MKVTLNSSFSVFDITIDWLRATSKAKETKTQNTRRGDGHSLISLVVQKLRLGCAGVTVTSQVITLVGLLLLVALARGGLMYLLRHFREESLGAEKAGQ